jgi:hypothetical protein
MKIEELVILGLTGAAAYLYWKMRSQKTAVVTQSITAPMTRSSVSTAVVPAGSQQPTMPIWTTPSLPEPKATKTVLVEPEASSSPPSLIKQLQEGGFVDIEWISPEDLKGGNIRKGSLPSRDLTEEESEIQSIKKDPQWCSFANSPPPIFLDFNTRGFAKHGHKDTFTQLGRNNIFSANIGPALKSKQKERIDLCERLFWLPRAANVPKLTTVPYTPTPNAMPPIFPLAR